ncbi:16S rRNA (guanine(966)-N(2))-methyltransferase RsmD [Syntrophorhabdus aromaticivorans]|jgi:16S rRNA (guanine(966)-N(2))-methyltransferase RsmD|uniref:16S rRNA (Guanine(966)-N(2))-methyltransferase RsmD n=1 Tax=Syntrophorhabdus aromaticivorans TaxID=328301 RepID=A0A351TZE8_9BACT|nr:16S rRNA (guanine(966)-N(2))-methyltransferase RsmD [Syntrophorhabdus aromaticivorans]NLW35049.1 16S rRNA (guanine(966)-N(2))-methyltransferase RsmD [Syntrophorhabdus aromaticivorans]HBA53079.1 16S rRNA (guanine(966)-N(2))-methyltransferase RsmD [Syntrophorhabdus aromaticivorans]
MGRLRITGGIFKGRNIALPDTGEARFTSSKVREALFHILGDVRGARILDLFAGSGSFAIEALSRGASSAVCVEADRDAARILKGNLARLSLNSCCHVLVMDVVYAIPFLYKKASLYDIIFMDPPYERGYIGTTVSLLERYRVYRDDTPVVLEHSKRETLPIQDVGGWHTLRSRRYGDTVITVLNAGEPMAKGVL